MDLEQLLRPHRKALVVAAETVVKKQTELPEKAQLNRLVAVCGEAACAEEIVNYLRYQTSRKNGPWSRAFADAVIEQIKGPLEQLTQAMKSGSGEEEDLAKVAAWRLYAVFLARAGLYQRSLPTGQNDREKRHDRSRR